MKPPGLFVFRLLEESFQEGTEAEGTSVETDLIIDDHRFLNPNNNPLDRSGNVQVVYMPCFPDFCFCACLCHSSFGFHSLFVLHHFCQSGRSCSSQSHTFLNQVSQSARKTRVRQE